MDFRLENCKNIENTFELAKSGITDTIGHLMILVLLNLFCSEKTYNELNSNMFNLFPIKERKLLLNKIDTILKAEETKLNEINSIHLNFLQISINDYRAFLMRNELSYFSKLLVESIYLSFLPLFHEYKNRLYRFKANNPEEIDITIKGTF